MGGLLLFPVKVHINESSTAEKLSFVGVANIAGVHIKMNISKGKLINVHIKDRKIINFKACVEGLFCTSLNEPTMITNTNNVTLNSYYYLFMVKQNSDFYTDSEIEGSQKVQRLRQHLYWLGTLKFKTYLQE